MTEIESGAPDIHGEVEKSEQWDLLMEKGSKALRVNNTLLDNEMGGTDLTVNIGAGNVCMEKVKRLFSIKNAAGKVDKPLGTAILTVEEKE